MSILPTLWKDDFPGFPDKKPKDILPNAIVWNLIGSVPPKITQAPNTNMIQHPEMVRSLIKPGAEIAAGMTASEAHLLHMIAGISGESGELLDAIKKHVIYKKPLDRANVIEELGDLEFYMEGLRQGLNITREETIAGNIAKLSVRYAGLKYTDAAAHARADKAI